MQSSAVGRLLPGSAANHTLKSKKKKKKKEFYLQEILSLEEEVEKKTTWENATVLFKSRLAVCGSLSETLSSLPSWNCHEIT